MPRPWEEVQATIERAEQARARDHFTRAEMEEGFHDLRSTSAETVRAREILGAAALVAIAVELTLMVNFVLFVWVLHIEF
jgi:hypothetical protein